MSTQGTTTVDFGAFPGSLYTTATVTGQASIASGSLVETWVFPAATTDHTVDEHIFDAPDVMASDVVAGVGFTIHATSNNTKRHYGKFNVAWVWNT